jgi:hypothetical protein
MRLYKIVFEYDSETCQFGDLISHELYEGSVSKLQAHGLANVGFYLSGVDMEYGIMDIDYYRRYGEFHMLRDYSKKIKVSLRDELIEKILYEDV